MNGLHYYKHNRFLIWDVSEGLAGLADCDRNLCRNCGNKHGSDLQIKADIAIAIENHRQTHNFQQTIVNCIKNELTWNA